MDNLLHFNKCNFGDLRLYAAEKCVCKDYKQLLTDFAREQRLLDDGGLSARR
jgi:hypothetical protein